MEFLSDRLLEEIAEVIDPQPSHRAPKIVSGGFSYVGIGDIDIHGRILHDQCRKVSEDAVIQQENSFAIDYEDIGFGKVGTVGKVVYFREPGRYAVSATLVIIKPRENEVDRHFLFHLLQSHQADGNITLRQTGTTRATLGIQQIRAFKFTAPPLLEQRRIAEILDAADDAIRQTALVIAKLRQVKAGLLHDLLTRGLDAQGRLRDPAAHPEQFKESPLGRIPREWEVGLLSEYASVLGGKRLPAGHSYAPTHTGYRYLRVTDFYEQTIDYNLLENLHIETFEALSHYEIHGGNLFISIAGSIGYVEVFRPLSSDRTILTENAARIVVTENIVPEFLAAYMNGQIMQKQIEEQKGTGGGVPKLALFRIRNLLIACPPIQEQRYITDALDAADARIRAEEATLAKLRQVKRGLMDDLLTGRVRV